MERYQVILAYDGSRFKGFQRQAKERSIQGVVEAALHKVGWKGISILAAGRTDTGAHATGQVISFDLHWDHEPEALLKAINKHLPSDVAALGIKPVRASFHPRHDASWRKYNYRIYCQPVRQPLFDPYSWRVWPAVNYDVLKKTAQLLVGTHDFGAFGTPPHSEGNTIRCVLEAGWASEAPSLIFEIKAHAFLYHMVRRLVFMQVKIAQGELAIADLKRALQNAPGIQATPPDRSNRLVHGLAPACGLILTEVNYPAGAVDKEEEN